MSNDEKNKLPPMMSKEEFEKREKSNGGKFHLVVILLILLGCGAFLLMLGMGLAAFFTI
jgi:hypothetical protein